MPKPPKKHQRKPSTTHGTQRKITLADLLADAPQPVPDDPDFSFALRHSPAPSTAARILRRVPKLREFLESEFERMERDPIHLISEFVADVEDGGTPRRDVLRWMANAFKDWIAAQGGISLDRAFGVAGERGKDPALKVAKLRFRDEELLSDVMLLCFAGATVQQACAMACRRFEESSAPEEFKQHGIEPETLAQKYKQAPWASKAMRDVMWGQGKPTPEEIAELLSHFPADSIPDHMRVYLRLKP